jgi:hypothetical protein
MPSPTSATVTPTLTSSLVEVAEQSFFAFAEAADPSAIRERWPEGAWVQTVVRYASEARAGAVELCLPVALAVELAAAFAGADPGDLSAPLIDDGTGELSNVVCGHWLTHAHPRERFTLQPPRVQPSEPPAVESGRWAFVLLNDVPLAFRASEAS